MKGFKNSSRMQSGFNFPTEHGFTGSSGQVREIRPHLRQSPRPGYKKGGEVKVEEAKKAKPITGAAVTPEELARLRAADKNPRYVPPKAPLAKGGKVKGSKVLLPKELTDSKKDHIGVVQKEHGAEIQVSMGRDKVTVPKNEVKETKLATGGVVAYAKGGDVAQDKATVKKAIARHVAAPKPRGHGVK